MLFPPKGAAGYLDTVFKRPLLCFQLLLFLHQEVPDSSRKAWTPNLSHPQGTLYFTRLGVSGWPTLKAVVQCGGSRQAAADQERKSGCCRYYDHLSKTPENQWKAMRTNKRSTNKVTRYKHTKINRALQNQASSCIWLGAVRKILILIGRYSSNCWRKNGKDQGKQRF